MHVIHTLQLPFYRLFYFVLLVLCLCTGVQAQTDLAASDKTDSSTFLYTPVDASRLTPSSTVLEGGDLSSSRLLQSTHKNTAPVSPGTATVLPRPPVRVTVPNQFQRFVQDTTGRLLPIYGRDLFESPQSYLTNTAVPAPDSYILGPGDEVQLQVTGPQDFTTNMVLDRNGQVNLPKVGAVTLAGVAVRDLEKTLTLHLGKVFTNFKVNTSLGRLRGILVYVVGHAQQPGTFQLSSLSTLVNALFASGGPSANGSMRAIELKRAGKTISTLDLYDFIAKGDKSHDVPLLSGDVIVIPPVGARVAVTGAVDQATIFELKPSPTSIADILSLGGGVPVFAQSKKALLERITHDKLAPRQIQEIVLDEMGMQQPLHDGDVLVLLDISPAFANAVTLQGVVAEPIRYSWFEGMKLTDLIPDRDALITSDYFKRKNILVQKADVAKESGNSLESRMRNMVDQINWDYAVIERIDRSNLNNQLIPFNLGRLVLQKDPTHNLALQPGDVVTILSQHDLRLPQERQSRLVRVEGEIAAPGVYQALTGETLPQLIKRVGGLTPQAYVFGIELHRESVRVRQQQNLDALIRRLEAQTQAQSGNLLANRIGADNTQAAVILQQQQAQMKSQIERLRTLKSGGRLALELNPQCQGLSDLPALTLEDGDHILIPSVPGFVAAFGSVNNENMFIYKPGKTVGDIIKSASLTEDAEPDQIFVLRADGSIVASMDHSGLFGGFESLSVMPGDTVVVPAKLDRETRYTAILRGFKDWTQILANLGLGAAAFKSMGY
jgi:protein involved in polysaccharide export with SLBB domain